jgi:hypothetical protein
MAIMGTLASIASYMWMSFSQTTLQIWASTSLVLIATAISPGLRSLIPRMVKSDETGNKFQINSIINKINKK